MPYYSIVMVSIGSSSGSYSTGSPSVSSFSSGECALLLNFSGTVHALSQLTPNLLPIFQIIIAMQYNIITLYHIIFKNGGEQVIIKTFIKGRV